MTPGTAGDPSARLKICSTNNVLLSREGKQSPILTFFFQNNHLKSTCKSSFESRSPLINNILFADMLTVLICPELKDKTPVNISRESTAQNVEGWGRWSALLPPPAGKQLLKPSPPPLFCHSNAPTPQSNQQ